jgi:hypothetical protein
MFFFWLLALLALLASLAMSSPGALGVVLLIWLGVYLIANMET